MEPQFLWYIPNWVEPGHRGDDTTVGWGSLEYSSDLAHLAEAHGWDGALFGTGWGRPDTFTVATALVARTTTFRPLVAARPGYWQPAHFASTAATLDQLSRGRLLINVVSGLDNPAAYGDPEVESPRRYARTREFLDLVRRLWTESDVTFAGEFYRVEHSTLSPKPFGADTGRHPPLLFGGASPAAERVSAEEADVQLFWGEPLDGIEERMARLQALTASVDRRHAPLEFGLRITTVVRESSDEAWNAAETRVAKMREEAGEDVSGRPRGAVGQQRLVDLAQRGDVLDSCLYTAPARYGGGGAATTWLVGSPSEVADALSRYRDLGIKHFILSDTPYKSEIVRVGDQLLPLLRTDEATPSLARRI